MSPRHKVYSVAQAVEKFQRAGWRIARQKGSHIMLVKTGYLYTPSSYNRHNSVLRKLMLYNTGLAGISWIAA